ncbi:hypothetical protein [Ectothiorhodospira shaposhnikovii]|uniref:hypothetical protein n=1 Tax=Ectothiorhodospira shaposhnikovii TaxID=1054 RepID=UPI0039A329D7
MSRSRKYLPAGFLALMTLLLVSGCGGGGGSSGSDDSGAVTSLSGLVTDPPIAGAAVWLQDAGGDALSAVERSDAQGRFQLDVAPADIPPGARLLASGGVDTMTGHDFQGLRMSAPWLGQDAPVISPLTTLVDQIHRGSGVSAQAAVDQTADLLGLSAASVMNDPAEDGDAQRASLLMTDLWLALRGSSDPMGLVVQALNDADGDFAEAARALRENPVLDLPQTLRDRLVGVESRARRLQERTGGTAQDMIDTQARSNVRDGLASFFEGQLGFMPVTEAEQANLQRLADAVWQAAGRRGMPADSPGIFNVARYLLQAYPVGIAELEDPGFQVPAGLVNDMTIAELVASRVLDHQVPLAEAEVLGMDNQARLEYFLRSDLSPYYRAERLFDGVYDDSVLDPVFAGIARGMAAAGLFDEADLTLRARIFQPAERANAFRQVGREVFLNGHEDMALNYWSRALQIQRDQLEARGIANLTGNDARFHQSLSDDFLAAGHPDRAREVIEPLLDFVGDFGGPGKPWTGNYFNITTAILNQAEERVRLAAEAGMTGIPREQALAATDLLRLWVDSMGSPQPGPTSCKLIQSQYTSRYAALYAHLGVRDQALAGIDRFEALLNATCGSQTNDFSRFYVDIIAPAYGALGETDRFLQLLADEVEPHPVYASAARTAANEIAVFMALAAAGDGGASAALAVMNERIASPRDRAVYMVHGSEGMTTDGRSLARRLAAANRLSAAREVADAGWALTISSAFIENAVGGDDAPWLDAIGYVPPPGATVNTAQTEVNQMLRRGCHAAALVTAELGEPGRGQERIAACWMLAQSLYGTGASTLLRAEAAWLLADGHISLGMDPAGVISVLQQQARMISANDVRSLHFRRVADLQSRARMPAQALDTLDLEAMATLVSMASLAGDDQTALQNALVEAENVAKAYLSVATDQRMRLHREGHLNGFNQAFVARAREGAHRLLAGASSDAAWGWKGHQALVDTLSNPTQRDDRRREGVKLLAAAGKFDPAVAWAEMATQDPERWRRLTLVAEALTQWDDFPGTDLARFDFDGDGRPDFFSPQYTPDEWMSSALELDDDIDGDGIPDAMDRTPYCPGCTQ